MLSSGLRTWWSLILSAPDALVGHVAVGAGHAGARVDALVPHLELGVLGLERRRAGLGVRPVLEADLVVVGEDLLDLEALGPRVDVSRFSGPLK